MVRLIKAFPGKMELHIVDGYVYQYKRAARGAARFLNYLRNQLEQNVRHVRHVQHVNLVDHGRRVGVGLGVVRAIESVNGKILCVLVWVVGGLYKGIIIWIKMCEVVWVAEGLEVVLGSLCGWVWGMVKTIFFQLGKCSKIFVNTSVFSDSTGMSTASFVSIPQLFCN